MASRAYNIAVIIAGIDEEYQNEILTGIEDYAMQQNLNISVFVSFSGVMGNKHHDAGEFNIFNLPDFRLFDGAILLTNTIAYQPVVKSIFSRIKEAGIPAVNIDNDIPDFYHIGIDNAKAMRELTEHFIKKHGCRVFDYISGPKDNPESNERLESFLSVLRENNITIEKERIFYGDFRSHSGREAVEYFMGSGLTVPDAIVCANDMMAVSVMTSLKALGYSVPDDIIVSGFDDTYSARNYPVEITSVERPLKRSGALACRMLVNHIDNVPQKRSVILDMYPHFTESCGCADTSVIPKDVKTFKNENYKKFRKFESTAEYLSIVNRMSCQLVECDSLSDFTDAVQPFIRELNPEEFYMCICTDWNTEPSPDKAAQYTTKGYTKDMLVPLAYRNGKFSDLPSFESSKILPGLFERADKGKVYYFIPLHYRERCLGYIAIMNCRFPLQSSTFQTWCITLSNMLENVRKVISLDLAVKKLNRLYTVDTLSGIYNRNGFANSTAPLFRLCIENHLPVMLMFLDMDGLKLINDGYGHSAGDNAIHSVSCAITDSCVNGEICCRFGGDEFIVFAANTTDDDALKLKETINRNIDRYNKILDIPYTLSASIGYHIAYPKENDDIFSLVTVADNVMYNEKKKKKRSKYLKTDTEKKNNDNK